MTLQKIVIYPIKSAGAIVLDSTKIDHSGLKFDRSFAIINNENKIITAREDTRLLSITPKLTNGIVSLRENELELDVNQDTSDSILAQLFNSTIKVEKLSYASKWISGHLGYNAHIIKLPKQNIGLSLKDDSPVHLITVESLKDLNSRLHHPVALNNFRANLIVSGFNAYQEETWNRIKIGKALFKVIKNCARCSMSSINNSSGLKNKELLKTLSLYKTENNNVIFGIYLKPLNSEVIFTGDRVEILN